MAEVLSSPSTASVVPAAQHQAIVAQLQAKISLLEADLKDYEDNNPLFAAFLFFALGFVVKWIF